MDLNTEKKYGEQVGFERIRRIIGYLVGTMDKWNDAKKGRGARPGQARTDPLRCPKR